MSAINNSKESILQRMYSRVASLWGTQSIEDLDPIVKMFMQGLASMFYDLHNEMEDMNVRVLESLASALTPSVMINPYPAHAIAQAYPVEPVEYIDRKTIFLDKKMSPELQGKGIKSLSFAPLTQIRLVSGKIKYLVAERFFYRIEENGEKTTVAQAHTLNEKTNYTAWIGLDLHPEVATFKGLSFYIDFPFSAGKYDKYKVLPYSRWSVGGQPLEMKAGQQLPGEEDEESGFIFDKYNLLPKIDEDISGLYQMQYLTVSGNIRPDTVQKEVFPGEIAGLFPERAVASEPCYWIKVVFPPHITIQDIHAVRFCINTFPVANKTFNSGVYPARSMMTGIIPLRTQEGEHFISVENVTDSHGTEYKNLPYTTGEKTKAGFYSIKRGGMERFDRRDASEQLERTIDLLRDEKTAFSSLGTDSLNNIIFLVQEGLKKLEIKYGEIPFHEFTVPSYLLLQNVEDDETIFAEYWATHCELANNLRAGKLLTPLSVALFRKDSCRLLTQTRGGKSEANATGRIDAFRHVLGSRDGIITRENVEGFCRYELGAKVTQVNVLRGVAVSPSPKEGLIRTIDIHLTPSPGCEQIVEEMQTDLLVMLHRKSPDSFNYRIIVETKK